MMRKMRSASCLLLLLASPGAAQERLVERKEFHLAFNAVLGGVYAAVGAADEGRDPLAAFLKGAAGGAMTWSGQRLIADERPALRLPGVQLSALGANIARNAARDVPVFSDITLPVYPFYVRVRPASPQPVTLRLSALAVTSLARVSLGADRFHTEIDWRESFFTGAPVFRSARSHLYPAGPLPEEHCLHGDGCAGAAAGLHLLGTSIYTTGGRSAEQSRHILAHEVIHLTQVHRDAILFGVPMSDALLPRLGSPFETASRFLVLDAFLPLTVLNHGVASAFRYSDGEDWRFYEFEARAHVHR